MKYLNFKHNKFNVAHFLGSSQQAFAHVLEDLKKVQLDAVPEDLTIMSVWTCDSKCELSKLLSTIGYNVINCYIPTDQPWTNPYKIKCILNGLEQVKTPYVAILDGYDIVFYTFDNIIEKFKSFNAGVVFNTSKNNYPGNFQEDLSNKLISSKFRYLNAGACIGYTSEVLKFYKLINEEYENHPDNKWHSEQLIVRTAFIPFKNYTSEYSLVKLDLQCDIFLTFGLVMLKYRDNECVIH